MNKRTPADGISRQGELEGFRAAFNLMVPKSNRGD